MSKQKRALYILVYVIEEEDIYVLHKWRQIHMPICMGYAFFIINDLTNISSTDLLKMQFLQCS